VVLPSPAVYDSDAPLDDSNHLLHLMGKRDIYKKAKDFEYYIKFCRLKSVQILENYVTCGPANIIRNGGYPSHKRCTIVQHKDLVDTFAGIEAFLPPYTGPGGRYPPDFEWAVWMQAPVSKTHKDQHYGAFMPVCKPYTNWLEVATSANGRTDPESPAHPMWTPVAIVAAMDE
jgi:hypothetical protein